jgi:hypothetical protein
MGKITKALYAGISAAVLTFTGQSASSAKIPLWGEILVGIGAGIVGFQTVYWAPKNSDS